MFSNIFVDNRFVFQEIRRHLKEKRPQHIPYDQSHEEEFEKDDDDEGSAGLEGGHNINGTTLDEETDDLTTTTTTTTTTGRTVDRCVKPRRTRRGIGGVNFFAETPGGFGDESSRQTKGTGISATNFRGPSSPTFLRSPLPKISYNSSLAAYL